MIATLPSLSGDDRRKLVDAVRSVIAFDASKGDEIEFGAPVSMVPWVSSGPQGNIEANRPAIAQDSKSGEPSLGLTALVAATVTAGVALLAWMWWNRRLSRTRRVDLATQLTRVLDAQEVGA